MAKVAYTTTEPRQRVGFDDLKANGKGFCRVYKGTDGKLKFKVDKEAAKSYAASTVGVYQLDVHYTTNGRILFPSKAVLELRKDLVADKHMTKEQATKVVPGKFGTFWVNEAAE